MNYIKRFMTDNCIVLKIVIDALNGLAYDDDKQVIEAICRKYYTDGEGYLWVVIKAVGDRP